MLKRLRTAPQGRGYRVRKRSNHVTLFVDSKNTVDSKATVEPTVKVEPKNTNDNKI